MIIFIYKLLCISHYINEGDKIAKCQKCNIYHIDDNIKDSKICKYCKRKNRNETNALNNSRVRYGNSIVLFDDIFKNTKVEYHHASDGFIIILPYKLHRKYQTDSCKTHKEKLKPMIEKLYSISYIVIEK